MRQVPSRERVSAGWICRRTAKVANGRRSAAGRQEATYKHYKYHGSRFHLSGAVLVGKTNQVPSFDEGVREGRGVTDARSPRSIPRASNCFRRRLMSTCRSTCAPRISRNCATFSKTPKPPDNDKFVAYTMLLNQTVSAEGELPTCQTPARPSASATRARGCLDGGRRRRECIARGVYETCRTVTCAIRRSCPLR